MRRHTIREVETDDGPKLIEQEASVPAWAILGGLVLAAVGIQRGIRTGTVAVDYRDKQVMVTNPAWLDWEQRRKAAIAAGADAATMAAWAKQEPAKKIVGTVKRPHFTLRSRDNIADYGPVARL